VSVRHIFGKDEIWMSLKTSDPTEAKKLHAAAHFEIRTSFESAQADRKLSSKDAPALAQEHYNEAMADDEHSRMESADITELAERNALFDPVGEELLRDALTQLGQSLPALRDSDFGVRFGSKAPRGRSVPVSHQRLMSSGLQEFSSSSISRTTTLPSRRHGLRSCSRCRCRRYTSR